MARAVWLMLMLSSVATAASPTEPSKGSAGIVELLQGTPSNAIPLLHSEAAAGSARAAAYMAVALEYGWGTRIDHQGAKVYARQASESGFAAATLLRHYEFDEPLSDAQLRAAKSSANKKAQKGDPLSLYYVGLASADDVNTSDVVVGAVAAVALLALAEAIDSEDSGYDDEDDDTDDSSDDTQSTDANYLSDKSKKYLKQSLASGFAPAALVLGQLHETGRGVPQDWDRALGYYRDAAHRDVALGAKHVGRLVESGHANDAVLVREGPLPWYERAAAGGDADAMNTLGMLHYRGTGVPRDRARAQTLLMQAAALGDPDANSNLRMIESEIAQEQAVERQRLAAAEAEARRQQARLAADQQTRTTPASGMQSRSTAAAIPSDRVYYCAAAGVRSNKLGTSAYPDAVRRGDQQIAELALNMQNVGDRVMRAYARYLDAHPDGSPSAPRDLTARVWRQVEQLSINGLADELMTCARDPRIERYLLATR